MVGRRARGLTRLFAGLAVAVAAAVSGVGATSAGASSGSGYGNGATYTTVAQAQPTECWVPPATPNNPTQYGQYVSPTGTNTQGGVTCPEGSQPKVNQAYVWGETHVGDNIFFGTAPNVLCLVLGGYLGLTTPMEVPGAWTCEFGQSPMSKSYGVPATLGDWRPPKLFEYNMATGTTVNLVSQQTPAAQATLTAMLSHTMGLRSAGEARNPLNPSQTVVFLAGPAMGTPGDAPPLASSGINVFAFDQNGTFLGATTLPAYNDIRTWLTVTNDSAAGQSLYAGVQVTDGSSGAILKWTPTATTLFTFTVVGTTTSEAAYLAAAADRIYATTWPKSGTEAGLYVSPTSENGYADGGLNGEAWTELWRASNYEPDTLVAATYGGGALSVYDTYVYWGTMHVPFVATEAQLKMYGASTQKQALADVVGTQRSVSIFRMRVGTTSPQLLYGNTMLPNYNPTTSTWQLVKNNMDAVPLYGSSGFGNPFNNYTWSMGVYDNQLYVGTMDWSFLIDKMWPTLARLFGLPSTAPNPFGVLSKGFGADLLRFPDTSNPAQVISIDGLGNPLNYGVRNMVPVMNEQGSENGLYLGMANPMNLATSGTAPITTGTATAGRSSTAGTNLGGWELIKLTTSESGGTFALSLSPAVQTHQVASQASVSATLTDDGQPVSSSPVTFVVTSGPDAGKTASSTTNGSGVAVFQWTGTAPGYDVVAASASPTNGFGNRVTVSATTLANVVWTSPSHTTTTPTTTVSPPPGPIVTAVYGSTADATAATEFSRAFPYTKGTCPSTGAAVVATTSTYQDALSSQFLAQSLTTGTLLTPTTSLSTATATALKNEGIKTVYIVGGPLAVTTTVAKAIANLPAYGCGGVNPSGKIVVHRIYGQTQYGTAEAVAEHVGTAASLSFAGSYGTSNTTGGTGRFNDTPGKGSLAPTGSQPTAILANGQEFQDAQAASMISYRTKVPLLLSPATQLSTTAVTAIQKLGIKQVILMGGPLAISNTVESALVAKTGVSVLRVAGKDYTDTARELARFEVASVATGLGWTPGHRIMVSRGNGYTDGIAGAVLENPKNTATGPAGTARPLLLTMSPTVIGSYLTTFLKVTGHTGINKTAKKTITSLTVLGGPLAVSTASISAMQTALSH